MQSKKRKHRAKRSTRRSATTNTRRPTTASAPRSTTTGTTLSTIRRKTRRLASSTPTSRAQRSASTGSAQRPLLSNSRKVLIAIVCALIATATILSGRLIVYAMTPVPPSAPSDETLPLPTELIIADTPSPGNDIDNDIDANTNAETDVATEDEPTVSSSATAEDAATDPADGLRHLEDLGDALSPSKIIEFAYANSLASAAPAESESESEPEPEPEPEPTKALPPVPDSAPDATAELVATSVFYELLPDYPYVTMNDLIALGTAVETPLYYAEPIDYTEDDLLWLARIIDREAGSTRYPDILQLLVGNVVLNRVASPEFPDDIKGVIFAPKAYGPNLAAEHRERLTPSDRAIQNARRLLDGQRFCPPSAIFQANGRQGTGDYLVIDDELSGRISYFCYAYHMQKYEA